MLRPPAHSMRSHRGVQDEILISGGPHCIVHWQWHCAHWQGHQLRTDRHCPRVHSLIRRALLWLGRAQRVGVYRDSCSCPCPCAMPVPRCVGCCDHAWTRLHGAFPASKRQRVALCADAVNSNLCTHMFFVRLLLYPRHRHCICANMATYIYARDASKDGHSDTGHRSLRGARCVRGGRRVMTSHRRSGLGQGRRRHRDERSQCILSLLFAFRRQPQSCASGLVSELAPRTMRVKRVLCQMSSPGAFRRHLRVTMWS